MSPRERRLIEGIIAAGDALSHHSDMDLSYHLLCETLRDAGYGSGGQPFESARRALAAPSS